MTCLSAAKFFFEGGGGPSDSQKHICKGFLQISRSLGDQISPSGVQAKPVLGIGYPLLPNHESVKV